MAGPAEAGAAQSTGGSEEVPSRPALRLAFGTRITAVPHRGTPFPLAQHTAY